MTINLLSFLSSLETVFIKKSIKNNFNRLFAFIIAS